MTPNLASKPFRTLEALARNVQKTQNVNPGDRFPGLSERMFVPWCVC